MNIDLKFKPKMFEIPDKNVITAIAIKIPGIAYPEIERFEIKINVLFFIALFPKLQKKENKIKNKDVVTIKINVLKFNSKTLRLST